MFIHEIHLENKTWFGDKTAYSAYEKGTTIRIMGENRAAALDFASKVIGREIGLVEFGTSILARNFATLDRWFPGNETPEAICEGSLIPIYRANRILSHCQISNAVIFEDKAGEVFETIVGYTSNAITKTLFLEPDDLDFKALVNVASDLF